MNKGLIFLCCSCLILLFSAINLSIGPIVSKKVGIEGYFGGYWGSLNCEYYKDEYEEKMREKSGKTLKYKEEWDKNECYRKKAMYNMEYTSFIFDIVIGFVCSLLGLLHQFELKKDFISKTGLIGLACGIVGFVLSFVYVIFNGIVYTNYYNHDHYFYKSDIDGAFAELNNDKYKCYYHDEPENEHALIAKYSDLIKKQYNYDKELYNSIKAPINSNCRMSPTICLMGEEVDTSIVYSLRSSSSGCKYLYVEDDFDNFELKDISDRFLTTLLLSLFICLAYIGLVIFGFLLFTSPNDSSVIKFDANTNTNTKI